MNSLRIRASAVAAALALLATAAGIAAPSSSRAGASEQAARSGPAPFARVYLALRGCTSCSHCRTAIRQMVRSSTEGGETRISDDRVEVRYDTARQVPLRQVIRSLAGRRLHDLSVVDVLFEARGTLATAPNGKATFTLAETGQTFPLSIASAIARPAEGTPVRLLAMVDGWRDKGALTLVAREVKAGA